MLPLLQVAKPSGEAVRDALAVNVTGTLQGAIEIFGATVETTITIDNAGFTALFEAS